MFMSGFFFSGSSVAKLDEKGRFVLPHEMRMGLVEEGRCEFAVGLGLGGCLAIYRKSAIGAIVERFRKVQHLAQYQRFFTLFFSTLHQTGCDKVGRILLPDTLRSAVKIGKEIVVAGVLDKIELWPKEVYDANLQQMLDGSSKDGDLAAMTEAAFALLNGVEPQAPQAAASTTGAAGVAPLNPLYFGSVPTAE